MGEIRCMAMMACDPVACTHPSRRPGNCCPSCTKCEWNNVQYRNGENFVNPRNSCEDCKCRVGQVKYLSCLVGKPTMWFPNRSDTNRPVQSQKMARGLKFWL